jgi:competence protein ComGC
MLSVLVIPLIVILFLSIVFFLMIPSLLGKTKMQIAVSRSSAEVEL